MSRGAWRALAAEIGRFVRANLSSTAATAVDWALLSGLVAVGLHYLRAVTVGAVAGAITDFILKRYWAFGAARRGAVHHEGIKYLLVSGGSLGLNLALAFALVEGVHVKGTHLHMKAIPGGIAASILVGFIWNYPLHRLFVFRRPSPPSAVPEGHP